MAKKSNKNKAANRKKQSITALSENELLKRSHHYLQQGNYQEAIACLKELLKKDESGEYLDLLSQAYCGRIESLASKSMFKEALMLFETMVKRCGTDRKEGLQLSLLMKAGRYREAATLYQNCHGRLDDQQQQRFETIFGALLLSETDLKPENFAPDSTVVRHLPAARTAMELACGGRDDEARTALKQIPLKSPFRDLRTLLTAMLHLHEDSDRSQALLQKIDKESPYFNLAFNSVAIGTNPQAFLEALTSISKNDHQTFMDFHGLAPVQRQALVALSRCQDLPGKLCEIVSRYDACFNPAQKTRLYQNILPFCGRYGAETVLSISDMEDREKARISALAAEEIQNAVIAVKYWNACLGLLDMRHPEQKQEMALILLRKAGLMKRDPHNFNTETVLNTIEESLTLVPDNEQAWLEAADLAGRVVSLNRSYTIINRAVEKMPDSVKILTAAMKACGDRGAHKKASGYAKKILEKDPINTRALDFLVESHLEHGRKLALKKNWRLAEKEFAVADTRVKAIRFRGRNRICMGMLALLQDDEQGLKEIESGKMENGSPLLSSILVSLEARLFRLPASGIKTFDKQLGKVVKERQPFNPAEFLRLISWIHNFSDRQRQMLFETCNNQTALFEIFVSHPWSREEGLSVCKALDMLKLYKFLETCANNLLKHFGPDPELKAYSLIGMHSKVGRKAKLPYHEELIDLQMELERRNIIHLADRLDPLIDDSLDQYDDWDDDSGGFHFGDLFNDGPFSLPKSFFEEEEKEKKPKQKPFSGKQLNLFDED